MLPFRFFIPKREKPSHNRNLIFRKNLFINTKLTLRQSGAKSKVTNFILHFSWVKQRFIRIILLILYLKPNLAL